jgi:glycerate kinase
MNILIAPDSFKEVADSDKVAELFKRYLQKYTSCKIELSPVSDGGDGFLNICSKFFNLQQFSYDITTPYDESTISCPVGYDKERKRLFIESARVLGLRIIPKEQRHPLNLSSKGLGDLLLHVIDDINRERFNVEEIFIGVGGTGTNDLGLGLCSRFGLELFDIYGERDNVLPEFYYRIKDIKWNKPDLQFKLNTIIDVKNPLLGGRGATKRFGPQKGADKGELEVLELGFNKIINILKSKKLDKSFNDLLGAGGGLAAGLYLFFDASVIPAENFIGDTLRLSEYIDNNDIIITGEGSFDEQSLDGKGAGIVLNLATSKNKKVFLCCGKIDDRLKKSLGNSVEIVEMISFFKDAEESMKNFEKGVELSSRMIASLI